ncbi:hypothetical protein LP419_33010 [Massilia sp. H-1]|nr:hypothetical protein LP419_33010 [Massilia sp. H-1]
MRQRLQAPNPLPAFDSGHEVKQLLVTERGVTRVIRVDEVQWIGNGRQLRGPAHGR